MGEGLQLWKVSIFTFLFHLTLEYATLFEIGACSILNPETDGFLWGLGFCFVYLFFVPFSKQSAGGTNQEDICLGYIIIFLRQSRFAGYSCADCAQNQPTQRSSGAKIYLYSAGQTLDNQAVTAERWRLFLICAKAPVGQCLSQRQRPYLPLGLLRLCHFEYMTAT